MFGNELDFLDKSSLIEAPNSHPRSCKKSGSNSMLIKPCLQPFIHKLMEKSNVSIKKSNNTYKSFATTNKTTGLTFFHSQNSPITYEHIAQRAIRPFRSGMV